MKDLLYIKTMKGEVQRNIRLTEHDSKHKFSICLMNPPYSGTLHLKFLENTLKISDKIICVHPIDKLVSPKLIYSPYSIQEYKKLEHIFKHCQSVEQIDTKEFKIGLQADCGITVWTQNEVDDWTPDKYVQYSKDENNVIKKIMNKITESGDKNNLFYFVHHRDNDGDIIQWIPAVHGHVKSDGGKLNDFYNIFSTDYKKAIKVKEPQNRSEAAEVKFKSEDERKNFIESTFLEAHQKIMSFWKTDTKIRLKFIPWFGNYSNKITNEDILNFFNLTEDEKKIFNNIQIKY